MHRLNTARLAPWLLWFLAASSHAQVYKCPAPNGQTAYSDKPCASGKQLDDDTLRANTLPTAPSRPAAQAQRQAAPARELPEPQATACATDRDIRNMETSASSTLLSPKEKHLAAIDIQRARACQPIMTAQERATAGTQFDDAARARRAQRTINSLPGLLNR